MFNIGVTDLKIATRQYARRQLKWIRNRFLKRPGNNVPKVYKLNSSDVSQWKTNVHDPAISIVEAIMKVFVKCY